METNRRRGMKAKFAMSFYRAPKPSSVPFSNKLMTPLSSSTASVGFVAEDGTGFIPSAPIIKASALKKEGGERFISMADHECVDNRAASYISYVQERFRMEQMEYDKMHPNFEV